MKPVPPAALALLAGVLAGVASAQAVEAAPPPAPESVQRLDGTRIGAGDLAARIEALRRRGDVHGLAVSVFNDGEIVFNEAFGVKRADTNERLGTDTVFYGASLSKAVFGVLVMRLVEEGVIDLDRPLVRYMAKPLTAYKATRPKAWHEDLGDLAGDPRHRAITARMCLSHTTGLPNWRWFEPDRKLRILFKPGSRYRYSGEGLTFLQVVLEERTKRSLEDLMREKVFGPYGMAASSYAWQPRFEANFCHGHTKDGKLHEKDKDNAARSASTLETTPDDYARFTSAVLKGSGLKRKSWNDMFSPQVRIRSKRQFGPLASEVTSANDRLELAYGLGWGLLRTPHGRAAFKEGHGDGFQHYSIVFPERGLGVVVMTNSDNGEGIFKELLELTIADVYTPWEWQDYVPYDRR
jgi:CubicO group peptidase (beta-lactamase class C family)